MKSIRLIILITIGIAFTFNSFGFIFYFLLEREYVKEDSFEKISEMKNHDRMEILTVSLSYSKNGNVIQRINKKEIRYEGKMFDIVKEETRSDKIIFYCVHDEKEDKLENEFAKTINKNLNRKDVSNTFINFNHLIQYTEYGRVPGIESPIQKVKYSNYMNNNYYLNTPKVLTPPPKFSFI